MVPVPTSLSFAASRHYHLARIMFTFLSTGIRVSTRLGRRFIIRDDAGGDGDMGHLMSQRLYNRSGNTEQHKLIAFGVLIPVLVLLSGLFAGLTLGYMSLDETQLNVLSVSGTPDQRAYANKIKPIRKDGHRLLVTLLLANMIVNESLPVIADPVLGGGVQGVVVSTVLIVIFAEIIPQSLFTRHGLYLGAKLAGLTKCLLYGLAIVAWPIAKFLELVLGTHHGLIYRRAELKELIAMHSANATHGGDLKTDTVNIIGATLDLQEKVVNQVMTEIGDVFMLSIDDRLGYDLLKRICETGHSRVPVYEEVSIPSLENGDPAGTQRVKRIIGVLLVKSCILLDPKDAVPIRDMPLNKVPLVGADEPLLRILDKFQEGRSHMAIVSRLTTEKAGDVARLVRREITETLRERAPMNDPSTTPTNSGLRHLHFNPLTRRNGHILFDTDCETQLVRPFRGGSSGSVTPKSDSLGSQKSNQSALRKVAPQLEQVMPADAVLTNEDAEEFLQNFDPAIMPLGIVTLEDVLEELIGEEIYDEFDTQTASYLPFGLSTYGSVAAPVKVPVVIEEDHSMLGLFSTGKSQLAPVSLKEFRSLRSNSAPPISRKHRSAAAGTSRASDDVLSSDNEASNLLLVSISQLPSPNVAAKSSISAESPELHLATSKQRCSVSERNSPAPSIEAVWLDRKRRSAVTPGPGGWSGGPTKVISDLSSELSQTAKSTQLPAMEVVCPRPIIAGGGAKFKSTPLVLAARAGNSNATSRRHSSIDEHAARHSVE